MQSYGNTTLGKVSLNTETVCTFDTRVHCINTRIKCTNIQLGLQLFL